MLSLLGSGDISSAGLFLRFLIIFFIAYFLSVVVFLFHHLKRVPTLREVGRVMRHTLNLFPSIFKHRVRTSPQRLRRAFARHPEKHAKVSAYPKTIPVSRKKK